jgi:hypothetical protein
MLRRFAIFCLILALVIGLTGQVAFMPMAMAVPPDQASDMSPAAPCSGSDMPCKGMMPACMDSMSCTFTVVLPMPMAPPTALQWSRVSYATLSATLNGRSIEPDLFPPIPA